MQKIPTVFRRDPDDMRRVLPEVTPGCEWVLAGEGVATRKYDGTCCMFDGAMWWARREVKPGKPAPEGFVVAEHDPATGKTQGWVPMAGSAFERWHAEALATLRSFGRLVGCALPPGTYELCGPKINGNPDDWPEHTLVRHETAEQIQLDELTFEGLRAEVAYLGGGPLGWEGIVWHHPDGRMAKLKARDVA